MTSRKRISPDTVIVDLTLDDDPEEDRRFELDSLRTKRFKPSSSSSSQKKNNKQQDDDNESSHSDSDSEVVEVVVKAEHNNNNNNNTSISKKKSPPQRSRGRHARYHRQIRQSKKVKRERESESEDDDDEEEDEDDEEDNTLEEDKTTDKDNDVSVVAAPAKKINAASSSSDNKKTTTGDDDIELVGTANETKLPHMRQHCTEFPYQSEDNFNNNNNNKKCCDLCYCYVCDEPAKDCLAWGTHCHATDTGPRASHWKTKRTNRAAAKKELQQQEQHHQQQRKQQQAAKKAAEKAAKKKARKAARKARKAARKAEKKAAKKAKKKKDKEEDDDEEDDDEDEEEDDDFLLGLSRATYGSSGAVTATTNRNTRLGGKIVKAGPGPFEPKDKVAGDDPNLTKCRKCGYYNRYFHRNFQQQHYKKLHPVGWLDWCHYCGQVASTKDFGKAQSKPFAVETGKLTQDVYLGLKVIPFTIFAHDPRQLEPYKKNWSNSTTTHPGAATTTTTTATTTQTNLTYDEKELQHDLFRHRLGARPTLKLILASVPINNEVRGDPTNTSFYKAPSRHAQEKYYQSYRSQRDNEDYQSLCCPSEDKFDYWNGTGGTTAYTTPSVDETEGILLKNQTDLVLLSELYQFDCQGLCNENRGTNKVLLGYEIEGKWDVESQQGNLLVKIWIRPDKISQSKDFGSFAKLFGAWYHRGDDDDDDDEAKAAQFPFKLSDIGGTVHAKPYTSNDKHTIGNTKESSYKITRAVKKIQNKSDMAVNEHNAMVADHSEQQHTLESGNSSQVLGGTCGPLELGFDNVLKRFFAECLVEDIITGRVEGKRWIDEPLGQKVSTHRRLAQGPGGVALEDVYLYDTANEFVHELNYLRSKEDVSVAVVNTRDHCRKVWKNTQSLKGLLDHCESLGHAKIPYFEGLTVELLQFQKESVQWALERETMEGGIQSLLWPKLPKVAEPTKELYFNPILEAVRSDKPKLCRGGLICDEMGLGKTIISLSLILVNPAPEKPESGTLVSNIDKIKDTEKVTWDKNLYASTSTFYPKRGRIISRGTLVVCKVSLVGQWIAEAKSKLKDPGMVYSYHGSNRKRDPKILSKMAIVVTTYETLMSDDNYFREKAKDSNKYCPPLEQIRWWRIICDESHEMGNPNARKTISTMNLHSDHRWLVSGTPMVSSIIDLKNQCKFIGIEHVDEIFNRFTKLLAHVKDPNARHRENPNGRILGHFMYLMRQLLMRHSQKQTYRGTDTTLMSLPPKTERVVEIEFDDAEREEYDELQESALEFYSGIRARTRNSSSSSKSSKKKSKLGTSYLELKGRLKPLQIACAGGPYPIGEGPPPQEKDADGDQKMHAEDDDDDDNEEEEDNGKKKVKKVELYSEFAFTSKVKTLIKELKEARDKDETSKSLVFSQFTSSLKYLQEELPKHGFQYRTLSGDMSMRKRAKALDDFQNDPPTTIFLLSMRAAAVGINLTQANRIFLLDTCFNQAMVKQAIGRVYRLGQKREVEVVRLVVKDSVESRITKMLADKHGDGGGDGGNGLESLDDEENCLVGSIKSDKTEILTEQFDLLFGYKAPKEQQPKEESYDNDPKTPDDDDDDDDDLQTVANVKKELFRSNDDENETDDDSDNSDSDPDLGEL